MEQSASSAQTALTSEKMEGAYKWILFARPMMKMADAFHVSTDISWSMDRVLRQQRKWTPTAICSTEPSVSDVLGGTGSVLKEFVSNLTIFADFTIHPAINASNVIQDSWWELTTGVVLSLNLAV